jgi:hypothetical protein
MPAVWEKLTDECVPRVYSDIRELLARDCVPHVNGSVVTSRGDAGAVRAVSDGPGKAARCGELQEDALRRDIPDLGPCISLYRGETRPIRAYGQRLDRRSSRKRRDPGARCYVELDEGSCFIASEHVAAVGAERSIEYLAIESRAPDLLALGIPEAK